jgi:hypothetical protein
MPGSSAAALSRRGGRSPSGSLPRTRVEGLTTRPSSADTHDEDTLETLNVKMLRTLSIGLGLLALTLAGCNELPTGPDITPPTISLTSPVTGSSATDSIVVQVTATDDHGIATVELFFDTLSAPAARLTASPFRLVGALADLGSGSHTFRVVATDSTGNSASVGPIAFTATVTPGLRFLGRLLVDGSARDVDASGAYAYVAAWDGGVIVIDISNPLLPATVTRYDTPGSANGVTLTGTRLLVADGVEGIVSLSVVDPANPVELARLKPSGMEAFDIAVSGNMAYVAGGAGGLYAIDITNPDTLIESGVYVSSGDVRDVEVSGTYAYTAEVDEGLRVVDINRADSMYAVDQYTSTGLRIYDVSLIAGYAFAACDDNGIQAIDISTPTSISIADFYARTGSVGVLCTGALTFAGAGAAGVEVINSSDPTNLVAVTDGLLDTGGFSYKLKMIGGYLLVADNTQLTILKYVAP